MFTRNDDIVTSLFPLCLVLKVTGFILFPVKKIRNCEKINYFESINWVVYIFHILYFIWALINTIERFVPDTDTLHKVYNLIFASNAFAFIGVNIIWDKYHNSQFLNLLRQFYFMDKKMCNNGIYLDYRKIEKRSALVILAETLFYTYFNIDTANIFWTSGMHPLLIIINFIYYQGLHAMQITMTAKCFTLFAIVENIFDRLDNKIQTQEISEKLIKKIRYLYHDTFTLIVQVNEVIAVQLVVPFCVTFILVVYHIYYQIVDSTLQESVTDLVWLSTVLTKIIVVIVQIHRAISGAEKLKRTAVELSLNRDPSIKREVNIFFLQLIHEKINITGAKFFDINISLIGGYFGKGIGYLLILYQSYNM